MKIVASIRGRDGAIDAGDDDRARALLNLLASPGSVDRKELRLSDGVQGEPKVPPEPLPPDWNGYLRSRFEQGRATIARGDCSETPPAKLMARVRARVEKDK